MADGKYRDYAEAADTADEDAEMANETAMTIWKADQYRKKSVLLEDSAGSVSGEFVYQYPPGIPLIAPGEIISNKAVELICRAKEQGINVQGMKDFTAESIEILDEIRRCEN